MIQIRKCESFTIHQATGVATLDPEKFRNLSIPYEGDNDSDFLFYISENRYELEEIWDEIDEESQNQLNILLDPEWKEYYNSTWKWENSWYESGREDETWTKTGGFEVYDTTEQN
jgi:hypothetical protein